MIKFENVSKRFNDTIVFSGLNFTIADGITTILLGPSGIGKSVFLKMVIGLIKPDEGAISIDGREVSSLKTKELNRIREQFGFVFQLSALFDSMTVEENVGLALRMHTRLSATEINRKVHECLCLVGLEKASRLNPEELSGGMKKRAAIARALARDPKYILYDEPTTGLDPRTAAIIEDLIIQVQQEKKVTSVVVTHDLASARKVGQHIALLMDGKVAAEGIPEQMDEKVNPVVKGFLNGSVYNK